MNLPPEITTVQVTITEMISQALVSTSAGLLRIVALVITTPVLLVEQASILALYTPVSDKGQLADTGFHISALITGRGMVWFRAGVQALAKKG